MTRKSIATCALAFAIAAGVAVPLRAAPPAPTYRRDILPIFQKNCISCHSPGKVAPMSFTTYESTRPWLRQIRDVVTQKKMPPGVVERHYGLFGDDASLSKDEIDTIVRWIDAGAPEGAAQDVRTERRRKN